METITNFFTKLTPLILSITALIVAVIKSKKEIEETLPQKIKKQCNIDMCIINRLESVKEFLKADRVQIYDFHNGIHYELKKDQGVASFFDVILNNKEREAIGFLAIQYENKDKVNFTKEEMNEILKLKFFIEENLEKMVTKK